MAKNEKEKKDEQTLSPGVGVGGTETSTSQTPPAPEKPSKKKTVEIDEDVLKQILEKQTGLEGIIRQQAKDITKLTEVADKGRLAAYERNQGEGSLIRTGKLTTWSGKIVLGWQMVIDEVGFVDGKLVEKQIIRLWTDAGVGKEPVPQDVNYLDFARHSSKAQGDIVKQSRTKDSETVTLQMKDGRQYEVDIRFIN